MDTGDPLKNPAFKPPGLGERLRESFLGSRRPFDCLQVEVTSFCGNDCVYCPRATQRHAWKSRHMEADTFARLWPIMRGSQRVHLQGWGEPMLHPRFFDFAALASRAGCDISTTSCGMRMDDDLAKKIIASGMDLIAFSLAGTDTLSNSARKGTNFNTICENIRYLRRAINNANSNGAPEIHLAYIMLADRMDAVKNLPGLMEDLDVEMAVVSTLDYLALPEQKSLALDPSDTEKIRYARHILKNAANEAEKYGRIIHFALPDKTAAASPAGCRENIVKSVYVDAEGTVSPCVYLNVPGSDPPSRRRVFGNVLENDPLEIWKNENYVLFRQSLKENCPDSACGDCPKRFEVER